MTPRRYEPRRPLLNELYSLAVVLLAPLTIGLVFPLDAFRCEPSTGAAPASASCAIVYLTADEEESAMAASRTAWKVNMADTRELHADLSVSGIPEEETHGVMEISERRPFPRPGLVRYPYSPLPPTLAAEKAQRIAPEATEDEGVAFPRSELLKID